MKKQGDAMRKIRKKIRWLKSEKIRWLKFGSCLHNPVFEESKVKEPARHRIKNPRA